MEKERLFTIGQFAALHQINKKTLMWYDEIGLFKPSQKAENGYRYYTYYQSAELEAILMLRELDMSIMEIKGFLENRSAESYMKLLRLKSQELEQKISRMKKIQDSLHAQENVFSELADKDLNQIEIVEKEEEYLYLVMSGTEVSLEEEIEKMIEAVKQHHFSTLHDTTYGSIISVDNLQNAQFDKYDGLFMKAPAGESKERIHVKPKGKYLQAYCVGEWERLPEKYREILAFSRSRGLLLQGYAYEMGVNEILINSMDDYITQIEIPILQD